MNDYTIFIMLVQTKLYLPKKCLGSIIMEAIFYVNALEKHFNFIFHSSRMNRNIYFYTKALYFVPLSRMVQN